MKQFNNTAILNTKKGKLVYLLTALIAVGIILGLISYLLPKEATAAWVNDSWKFRKKLVIDASQVSDTGSADYSNFPVLVSIDNDASLMNNAQTDGDDILFTSSDGTTQLDHEIESYDSTKGTLRAWVEVTTLDYNEDTTIYIYYGNSSAASQSNKNGVWDANTVGAWHLNNNDLTNSTSTANLDGTNSNTTDNPNSKIAGGRNFPTGSTTYVTVNDNDNLDITTNLTVEAWVKLDSLGASDSQQIFVKHEVYISNGFNLYYYNVSGFPRFYFRINTGSGVMEITATNVLPSANNWFYLVGTYNGSQINIYINGTAGNSPQSFTGSAGTPNASLFFSSSTSSDALHGNLDEVRISNTARTAGWIATEYNNQNSPSTFFKSVGREEKSKEPVLFLKFDEGTGTVANDSSSQRNNGTLSGTTKPAWQSEDLCVFGKCLYFEGSTAYVGVGSTSPNINTVSFWVKPKTNGEDMADLDGGTHTITADNGTISANGFSSPAIYVNGRVSSTLTASDWQYITVTSSTSFSSASIKIGAVGSSYLNGFIDEFKVYDYVRSASQVLADYNARGSPKGASAVLGAKQSEALSEGLIGYWKMDETATPSLDSSGNSNSGTWNGNTAATTGKFSNGASFDGTGDYIGAGVGSSLRITSNISQAAWIYPTALPSAGSHSTIATRSNNYYFQIYNSSGTGYSAVYLNSTSNPGYHYSNTAISLNTWTHVAYTYDGSQLKIYINGALDNTVSTSGSIADTTDHLGIGANLDATGGPQAGSERYFTGRIDEARVYNRALSPKEVRDLYNFAPGPLLYYNFDEKTGTTAYDTGSGGNNGTLGGDGAGTDLPAWANGKYGGGLKFDGTDDYISGPSLGTLGAFSVEFWFNPDAIEPNGGTVRKIIGSSDFGLQFGNWAGSPLNYLNDAGWENSVWDTGFTAKSWQHVAVTFNSGTYHTYVNGVEKSLIFNNSPLRTSRTINSLTLADSTTDFQGYMDEVKIYNYARTQKQIVEDMLGSPNRAVGGGGGNAGAVGYWDLDEGQGTTAHDLSINRNDLTLSSASWTKSGKFGMAWNGTGALWLSRADDADFDFLAAEDLSLSLWFKSDSATNPGASEYLIDKGTTVGYSVFADANGKLNFSVFDGTNTDTATTNSDIYDGNWHHILAEKTGTSKIEVYVDGKFNTADSSIAATGTLANASSLYLGDKDGVNNGDEFNGDLDEIKVYRYALSSDEVKTEFNQGKSIVLGALGSNPSYPSNSSNQEYCVPGDSTSCAAPVGEWKFEEKTGTSANDTSGNGNTGTLTSGPTWASGKYGGALNFTAASSQYVDIGTKVNGLPQATSAFTIEAWIYPTDLSSNRIIYGTYSGNGQSIGILTTGALWYCNDGICASTASSTTGAVATNAWQHAVVTYDAASSTTNFRFYVNGKDVSSDTTSSTQATGGSYYAIGRRSGTYFQGKIDEVRIFNYARTPAQIAWDYNKGKPVAYWDFDECTGSSVYDRSGNNNTGTINLSTTGTQTTAIGNGTCTTNASTPWYNGRTGKRNYSLNFDGTSDYVAVTDSNSLDMAGDFSLSTWVNLSSTPSDYAMVFTKRIDNSYEYWMAINTSRQPYGGFGAMNDNVTSDNALSTGQWYHLVVVLNTTDNNLKLYVNGKLDKTASANSRSPSAGTNNVGIGGFVFYGSAAYLFPGQIDDVKVFNYALTATQVKNEYNQGAVNFGPNVGSP